MLWTAHCCNSGIPVGNYRDICIIPEIALSYDGAGRHLLFVFASLCEIILAQGLALAGRRTRTQLAHAHPARPFTLSGGQSWRAPLPPAGGESRRDFRGSGQHLLRVFAALRDKNSIRWLTLTLKAHLVIDARDIAAPFAVIFLQQYFRDGFSAGDDFAQRVEIAGFIVTAAVQAIARC